MIFIQQTGGYGLGRFSWPLVISVIVLFLITIVSMENSNTILYKLLTIVIFTGCIYILVTNMEKLTDSINGMVSSINNFNNKSYIEIIEDGEYRGKIDQLEKNRYIKMQSSVPENEIIFARLRYSFLLDFNRNQIYLADGVSSLPDGMPLFKGSAKLANYLINHNICFLAYSYKSEANYRYDDLKGRLKNRNYIANEAKLAFDFQRNISELGSRYKRIYDDGGMFVIDLKQPI